MVNKLFYIKSPSYNPYYNLALEEYLLSQVGVDSFIVYLWQNKNTVVIGRNQHALKECDLVAMSKDNVFLARRKSGGGAVYHDLGNLNFSLIATSNNYDQTQNFKCLIKALNKLGLEAKFSGRNDLEISGKKFSGNAFYHHHKKSLHHGTLLVDVNFTALNKYLKVSQAKLRAKGVDSVESRVINLKSLKSDLTIEGLQEILIKEFEKSFGLKAELKELDQALFSDLIQEFSSKEYLYQELDAYKYQLVLKLAVEEVAIYFNYEAEVIKSLAVFSDSMDIDFADLLHDHLLGKKLSFKFDETTVLNQKLNLVLKKMEEVVNV